LRTRDSWSIIFLALMLGLGITVFMFSMLLAAAYSGTWKLTIWTNTIGEGWPEILLFVGVISIQSLSLLRHWHASLSTQTQDNATGRPIQSKPSHSQQTQSSGKHAPSTLVQTIQEKTPSTQEHPLHLSPEAEG
jgi:hypothetical protein